MQFNTVVRLGSLAFNVAQDEKVQELFTMIHNGAKRRGMMGVVPMAPTQPSITAKPAQQAVSTQPVHPIPFSPSNHQAMPTGGDWGKYLNKDNAMKVLGWAGQISSLLVK